MIFPTLLGFATLFGLLVWALRAHSQMWRVMAASYAAPSRGRALATRFPEQVIVAGGGLAFRSYVPLTIGIHEKGISLRLLPPFSLACPAVFLPFDEMSCRRTDWFLSRNVFAIRLARAEVDIIVAPRLWDWIQSHSDLALSYASDAGGESNPGLPS